MPHAIPYERELLAAQRAVQRASELTRNVLSLSSNKSNNASSELSETEKKDRSPVTSVDFAAQALIIGAIHDEFPEDGFVGEEDATTLRTDPVLTDKVFKLVDSMRSTDDEKLQGKCLATPETKEEMFDVIDLGGRGQGGREGRFWVLDPIDGTKAYVDGGQYAVSLALIVDGREVLGVLGCPNLSYAKTVQASSETGDRISVTETSTDEDGMGLMLSAVAGHGAEVRPMVRGRKWMEIQQGRAVLRGDEKEQPVELKDLHFIDSSTSTASRLDISKRVADGAGAHKTTQYPGTELYSSHMRYAALTLGGREYVQVRVPTTKPAKAYIWDHAGAQLIYKESRKGRGVVTDLYGKEIDFGAGRILDNNWGVITADESVHSKIVKLVGEILDKE